MMNLKRGWMADQHHPIALSGTVAPAGSWNRFAHCPRWLAVFLLILLTVSVLYGSLGHIGASHIRAANSSAMQANGLVGDHALYSEIARRLRDGTPYYQAAAAVQRENHYPTRPFLTIRLPSYAYLLATLGEKAVAGIGMMLGGLAIILWARRLYQAPDLPRYAWLGALIMAPNILLPWAARPWVFMHESMAGTLIALALALYQPARPWVALVIMAAAVAIRESVLPLAILFGLFALWDRDWRAVGGWLLLGAAFLAIVALHIQAISAVILPTDLSSIGWHGHGGWLGYSSFLYKVSIFRTFPGWLTAILLPLAFLGWASWKSRIGLVCFLIQLFYAVIFMTIARPDNFYWALLVTPTLFIGLVLAPEALLALLQSLRHGRNRDHIDPSAPQIA